MLHNSTMLRKDFEKRSWLSRLNRGSWTVARGQ